MSQTNVSRSDGSTDGGVMQRARRSSTTMVMLAVGALLVLALAWYAIYAAGVFRSAPSPTNPASQSGQTGTSGSASGGSSTGAGASGGSNVPSNPAPRVPGY